MPTSVRLDKDTEERLARLAANTGRSQAFYLREAIESSLPRLEWEYDVLQRVHAVRSGKSRTWTLDEVEAELGLDDQV
jgi:RHH-type rel operon transcriptional repressor/antitoxin RelB